MTTEEELVEVKRRYDVLHKEANEILLALRETRHELQEKTNELLWMEKEFSRVGRELQVARSEREAVELEKAHWNSYSKLAKVVAILLD